MLAKSEELEAIIISGLGLVKRTDSFHSSPSLSTRRKYREGKKHSLSDKTKVLFDAFTQVEEAVK